MTVSKRKGSHYWHTRFTVDGVRIQESTGETTHAGALKYEDMRKQQVRNELVYGVKPKTMWLEAANRWIDEKQHKRTIKQDIKYLEFLKPFFGALTLDAIDSDLIESVAKTKEKGNSPATVNRLLALIKSIMTASTGQWQYIKSTPHIRMRKETHNRIRYITIHEARLLAGHIPSHLQDCLWMSLWTGLRASNIKELKWNDVDLNRRILTVQAKDFKTNKDFSIPLNDDAINLLIRLKLRKSSPFVFNYKGKPIGQLTTKAWYRGLRLAEIDDFRWHDLRHTFASWHVQRGTPIHIVSRLLGHSNIQQTMKYAHMSVDELQLAANAIREVV